MSDRKYRQRGYQDEGRAPERERGTLRPKPAAPSGEPRGRVREPRAPNMPGFRSIVRCVRCGNELMVAVGPTSQCSKCGVDVHTCAQCGWFDTSARFECMQPVPERVTPKDVRNTCTLFDARETVERETTTPKVSSARQAFDDLFK